MENTNEVRKIIADAKNICLIPSENEPESLTAALALFYTLRELGKNVNLIADSFPAKIGFLVPSVDFLSTPKNFVISIPKLVADVSQVYYEKTDENLKIYLTTERGQIKKENISFYFQETKPDLVITLGVSDFKKYLESKLDSFGFLLGSSVINIDNNNDNLKFGQVNLVDQKSLSEISLELIKTFDERPLGKNAADCLFAGLAIYYDNFKNKNAGKETFELAASLIKSGADNQLILSKLQAEQEKGMSFWNMLFENLKRDGNLSFASLAQDYGLQDHQVTDVVDKVRDLGTQNDLLITWHSYNSDPITKGFLYSKNINLLEKLAIDLGGESKSDWVFFKIPGDRTSFIKEKVISLLK